MSTVRQSERICCPDFNGESINTARIVSKPTTVEEAMSFFHKRKTEMKQ